MIISHKHRFIYIKVRKTAGTSIEIALSRICGQEDVITPISKQDEQKRQELGFPTAQNYDIPRAKWLRKDRINYWMNGFEKPRFYNHMPAGEIAQYVDEQVWNSYFKFTLDRNPFDKVVSLYYFRGGHKQYDSISDFIKGGGLNKIKSFGMYSIDNLLAVDEIYCYEDLPFFERDISERLGLSEPFQLTSYRAKGNHRVVKDYKDILDPEAIEMVKVIFAREIQLLGYRY
ncbi:MAG: sulfotransferase family 2 domain-containing protein [Bacteroidota bacterium]